ncbi:type I restriction enzyme, R subunit [Arthrobacter subterraneus]|uniref:Type I restriction enzyme, R subunit n=1 Tax=Arthrobacter subterraneus TaxID=335973 RepID=A0A1G8NHW8_9MICC|nr:DEAD/DEAH box helicase family protein [Arthrobacter subterraneus]SDI79100.1 type I restriction enzyme, R subunit [Arthrobacter subterraneus]
MGDAAQVQSNFAFLHAEWPDIAAEARNAERFARIDPRTSLLYCRRTLEFTLQWIFTADTSLNQPYKDDINGMLNEPTFKRLAGERLLDKMHAVRKISNKAVHTNVPVSVQISETILRELFQTCFWLAHHYSRTEENRPQPGLQFTAALLNPQHRTMPAPPKPGAPKPGPVVVVPKTAEQVAALAKELEERDRKLAEAAQQQASLEDELKDLREQIQRVTQQRRHEPDPHDYNEGITRTDLIDPQLQWAGWDVNAPDVREFAVDTMPTAAGPLTGKGAADYVLWGANGLPLAVVEAKRTSKDPHNGRQQARLYADCLERRFGQRPIIYFTNGYQTYIWDDAFYSERKIQGFHTRDQLQLMVDRRSTRKPLAEAIIDNAIVERDYQHAAIRAVTQAFEKDAERRALVVMATGTGKTRTVIALADLFMKANWVKRVLFLADRVALVDQAAKAFKTHLPGSAPEILGRDKVADSRIHLATYPTMMNLIDETVGDGKVNRERYGIGHYDLIIVDEAHRSVYQKYKAIFDYFDSFLIGLTATPTDDVDRNTFALFNIEDNVPTFAYELNRAIEEGWLVPPRIMEVPLKFPYEGIRYEDLSEQEKDEWDSQEWDDDGEIPDEVDRAVVNKWLFNQDTVDKALQVLMERGHRVAGGDRIGKTIIFARNNDHARFIEQRFNANYPAARGEMAQVITYDVNYASTLIESFGRTEGKPDIAISVDMLDTGIDVPQVVNLVFFKLVRSKTKFWQMVGRGTRLSPDLYGPDQHKQDFLIFDLCRNAEFFNARLALSDGQLAKPLAQRTFITRVQLLQALQSGEYDGDYLANLRKSLHGVVKDLPRENFRVRPRLEHVDRFSRLENWGRLDPHDVEVLESQLSDLATITAPPDTEEAKRFDQLMLTAQLVLLTEPGRLGPLQRKIMEIASALQDQPTIPAIAAQLGFIEDVLSPLHWEAATPLWLEEIRRKLRSLVHLIEKKRRKVVYTDFEDVLGEVREVGLPDVVAPVDMARYSEKVRVYLADKMDHATIQRLRRNRPLTELDLQELERLLLESGAGSREDLDRAASEGLGYFVRSLVGLEPDAVKEAMAEFIAGTTLTAAQLDFVNMIVQHLTRNGVMEVGQLYESPFNSLAPAGPEQLFREEDLDALDGVLRQFRETTRAS